MGNEGKREEDCVPQFRKNELQSRNSHKQSLSLSFLICVNGMLSCGLAFCSSELPVRSYEKGIKIYRCKYATTGSYPRTNDHASNHVKRTLTLYSLTGLCFTALKATTLYSGRFFRASGSNFSRLKESIQTKMCSRLLHKSLFKSE